MKFYTVLFCIYASNQTKFLLLEINFSRIWLWTWIKPNKLHIAMFFTSFSGCSHIINYCVWFIFLWLEIFPRDSIRVRCIPASTLKPTHVVAILYVLWASSRPRQTSPTMHSEHSEKQIYKIIRQVLILIKYSCNWLGAKNHEKTLAILRWMYSERNIHIIISHEKSICFRVRNAKPINCLKCSLNSFDVASTVHRISLCGDVAKRATKINSRP